MDVLGIVWGDKVDESSLLYACHYWSGIKPGRLVLKCFFDKVYIDASKPLWTVGV